LWDDEKSLVRWRTLEQHHQGQEEGRAGVLDDYHLRVGEVTRAAGLYAKRRLGWMTRDETQVSDTKALSLIDSPVPFSIALPTACKIFDHLTQAGRTAALCEWPDVHAADRYLRSVRASLPSGSSSYAVRVIRDYGMHDRREAPQFMR